MIEAVSDFEVALKTYFDAHHAGLQAAVLAIFAGVNSIRILAYLPQIVKAARDSNGASAISYATWGLFLVSHLTTILYAVIVLSDLIMAAIFFGNSLACLAILLVAMWNRRRYNLRNLRLH